MISAAKLAARLSAWMNRADLEGAAAVRVVLEEMALLSGVELAGATPPPEPDAEQRRLDLFRAAALQGLCANPKLAHVPLGRIAGRAFALSKDMAKRGA